MVEAKSGFKFSVVCIAISLIYGTFVFVLLPFLIPDPVTLHRELLAHETHHMGNLTNFTMETGGKPIRSLLVSFKGSGAINLLNSLSHQPGCYHHFAPLLGYQRQIKDAWMAKKAQQELQALYKCDYNQSYAMLSWGKKSTSFRRFYGQQLKICSLYSQQAGWDADMLANLCRIYPFINISVYNLGLKHLATLLEQEELNVRIVLLVRDPRGTMHSRAHRRWCAGSPDCSKPIYLCKTMVDDYHTAQTLIKNYPDRFRTVRFEDLVLQPLQSVQHIFEFYGLPLNPEIFELSNRNERYAIKNAAIKNVVQSRRCPTVEFTVPFV